MTKLGQLTRQTMLLEILLQAHFKYRITSITLPPFSPARFLPTNLMFHFSRLTTFLKPSFTILIQSFPLPFCESTGIFLWLPHELSFAVR